MLGLTTTYDHTAVYVPAVALVLASAITALGTSAGVIVAYVKGRARGEAASQTDPESAAMAEKERREYRAKVDEVHNQLANNHEKNFREEFDEKFDQVVHRLDRISADIGKVKTAASRAATAATSARKTALATAKRLDDHIDGR